MSLLIFLDCILYLRLLYGRRQLIRRQLLPRNRMRIMKRHNLRIRPQMIILHKLIWTRRILRKSLFRKRHILRLRIRPSSVKVSVILRSIIHPPNLPFSRLGVADVLVLVDAVFPPLGGEVGEFGLRFVGASLHEAAEPGFCAGTVGGDVNYVLELEMV